MVNHFDININFFLKDQKIKNDTCIRLKYIIIYNAPLVIKHHIHCSSM